MSEDGAPPTIDDLKFLVCQIGELWEIGDNQIMLDARSELRRVIHESTARLRKTVR